jgi:hypothetical protein
MCDGGCILAIVGSRDFAPGRLAASGAEYAIEGIRDAFDAHKPRLFVSGGAVGIDTMAEREADRRGIPKDILLPTVKRFHGSGGYQERDRWIAEKCEHLVRISSTVTTSYGSGFTADYAEELGKQVERVLVKVSYCGPTPLWIETGEESEDG